MNEQIIKINGQEGYPCIYPCDKAIWIENLGLWICDDPNHATLLPEQGRRK